MSTAHVFSMAIAAPRFQRLCLLKELESQCLSERAMLAAIPGNPGLTAHEATCLW
jgi:hypothetical protein